MRSSSPRAATSSSRPARRSSPMPSTSAAFPTCRATTPSPPIRPRTKRSTEAAAMAIDKNLARGAAEPRKAKVVPLPPLWGKVPRATPGLIRGSAAAEGGCSRSTSPLQSSVASRPLTATPTRGEAERGDIDSAAPRLRVQSSAEADRIIAIARSWIGTPYVHQASLKGVGCDCLGLLRGIWRELHGEEPEEIPPYSLDWAEATGAETLYMALERHCREISPPLRGECGQAARGAGRRRGGGGRRRGGGGGGGRGGGGGGGLDALQPGDIALFRMLPRGPA